MLTNPRDAMLDIYSVDILVSLHLLQYRKAYCTPSTAARGSASDVLYLTCGRGAFGRESRV